MGGSSAAEKDPESLLLANDNEVTLRQKDMSGNDPLMKLALTTNEPKTAKAGDRVPLSCML